MLGVLLSMSFPLPLSMNDADAAKRSVRYFTGGKIFYALTPSSMNLELSATGREGFDRVAEFRGVRPAQPSVSDLQGKDRNGCTISISTATGRINLSKRVGRAFRPSEVGVTNGEVLNLLEKGWLGCTLA